MATHAVAAMVHHSEYFLTRIRGELISTYEITWRILFNCFHVRNEMHKGTIDVRRLLIFIIKRNSPKTFNTKMPSMKSLFAIALVGSMTTSDAFSGKANTTEYSFTVLICILTVSLKNMIDNNE